MFLFGSLFVKVEQRIGQGDSSLLGLVERLKEAFLILDCLGQPNFSPGKLLYLLRELVANLLHDFGGLHDLRLFLVELESFIILILVLIVYILLVWLVPVHMDHFEEHKDGIERSFHLVVGILDLKGLRITEQALARILSFSRFQSSDIVSRSERL